jgi:large subunit ribosomal protein L17
MRHRIGGYKLGRDTEHRKAMWRNMAISLFTHGQVITTLPRAKSVQPFVERLITLAKRGDLASRRRVIQRLGDPILVKPIVPERFDMTNTAAKKKLRDEGYRTNRYLEILDGPRLVKHLFDEVGPRYAKRDGGYTRIVRLGDFRLGDGGARCVLQLVQDQEDGPQIPKGGTPRRRQKAVKRAEFAAQLRKARQKPDAATPEAPQAPTA